VPTTTHATDPTTSAAHVPTRPPRAPARVSAPSHDGLAALQADIAHQMHMAGSTSGAVVYDYTAQRLLFAVRANDARPPASVEKLYTSTAALALLGPTARLSTTVLGTGSLGADGTWHGNLYVHGGGDPTLGSAAFDRIYADGHGALMSTLAQRVRAAGIRRVTGHVIADESLLDTERGPVSSDGVPDLGDLGGQLSALTYNHGYVGPAPKHSWHAPMTPATYAGLEFSRALARAGVRARPAQMAHTTPAGAEVLAGVQSAPMSELLGLMNRPSDDLYAELLLKQLGVRFDGAGTTAAGAASVERVLAGYGLHPHVVDGSGLSRLDDTTPRDVVQLLVDVTPTSLGPVLRASLPVAAVSGTLQTRMRHTVAAGRCEAKTGTLNFVTNLAGYCHSLSGHLIVFALFMDGVTAIEGHTLQDHILITLTRDDPSRP
jgi:D-alanyl-D-alanine carboxypeptidase/D-alanyl-D-alanine-endopeptidase (penicillin-binding protein 4)